MLRKPKGTLFYGICKRTFDMAFSVGCAAVLAIPMAYVCAAICVEAGRSACLSSAAWSLMQLMCRST